MQFKEYLERAEYLKRILDGRQEETHTPQNGVGPGQKSRPPGGGGGGGKDDVSICSSVSKKKCLNCGMCGRAYCTND